MTICPFHRYSGAGQILRIKRPVPPLGNRPIHAEDELIAEAQHRIEDQLVELMRSYKQPLYKYLFVLVGDEDVVLDCIQDTFLRAYENLRKGRSVNSQWLYKVARNRAIDEFRHRKKIRPDLSRVEDTLVMHVGEVAEAQAVQAALAQLSLEDRETLYLFAVDGFKTAEIAAMLGVGAGAVRMRLSRARERFRQAYGERP